MVKLGRAHHDLFSTLHSFWYGDTDPDSDDDAEVDRNNVLLEKRFVKYVTKKGH